MKEMLKKEQDSMIEITQTLKEKKDMESELSKVRNRNEKLAEELADANAKLKKLELTNEENSSEVQRYKDALENAEKINYKFKLDNNKIVFDAFFLSEFKNLWKDEEVYLTVHIPEGTTIYFENSSKFSFGLF